MATVLRLKRSYSDDPAEGLVVCSKRLRTCPSGDGECDEESRYFSFIGSFQDENRGIEKELISKAVAGLIKQDSTLRDPKIRSVDVTAKRRLKWCEKNQEKRLRLVNSVRTFGGADGEQAQDDLYHLYDVIEEPEPRVAEIRKNSITCNGVTLVRTKPTTYDLYYTSREGIGQEFIENAVSIEKYSAEEENERHLQADSSSEDEGEDEDSNDENNWRNDYPDEDNEFEREIDYYGDYDDDEEEILNMIESCNVRDELCSEEDSASESPDFSK